MFILYLYNFKAMNKNSIQAYFLFIIIFFCDKIHNFFSKCLDENQLYLSHPHHTFSYLKKQK